MSPRRHIALASIVVAVATLAGCILVSDFSGLSGGSATSPDASTDARSIDAAGMEATTDAGVDASDAGPTFTCDGALFCDRFDTGAIAPPWTRPNANVASSVQIEPTALALSAPNVLFTSVVREGTAIPYAYVVRDFLPAPAPITTAKLTFAVLPERFDEAGEACIATFVFGEGTDSAHTLRLLVGKNGATLEERTTSSRSLKLVSSTPLGRWSRVALGASRDRVFVEIDGATILDTVAYAPWDSSDRLRLVVGVSFATDETVDGFTFRFDDVRFDGS